VRELYKNVSQKLAVHDQDQDVKEAAIICMANFISHLGDYVSEELGSCFSVLIERLHNEITRLSAVKAFTVIAESPLELDIGDTLETVASELTAFLRKALPSLRQHTLVALDAISKRCVVPFDRNE